MIFAGTKTVELRRVCPSVIVGDLALVYVSSPAKEVQGAFEVGKIISGSPTELWKKIGAKSGVTRIEFFAYFHGKKIAHALTIKKSWKFPIPLCLATLRTNPGGFRPPQNYHYLRKNLAAPFAALAHLTNN